MMDAGPAGAGDIVSSNHDATDDATRQGLVTAARPGPIVAGIGASAGGIEALGAFFDVLPEDTGVAFVIVVHLAPERRSLLAEILRKRTRMPVEQVTSTVALEANRVYVIPPDRRLEITDSSVAAVPFEEQRGLRAPIDLFFRSLADQHGDGFAVVLSGGGSDGAVGVKAVKEAGGLVLVQDPAEAAHDSMPRAAIATHVADLVLPVRDLAGRLAELARIKRRVSRLFDALPGPLDTDDEATLGRILAHLHGRTGHDFTNYKRGTVLRRVGRRMQVRRTESLGEYFTFLRQHVDEAHALFDDLLISVTTFFRDPEAWDALAQDVIPRLFDENGEDRPDMRIRVWAPGCATGEEAYSLAMLLLEEAHRRDVRPELQIFASDLDERALAVGREGRYSRAIAADVSEERLRRFFREEGEEYCVTKQMRDCVLFTSHNLLRDPPFSRLDLVSCRNLLIYLERDLQQQVFGVFRYALRPGRFLFLGASETAEGGHFRALDKQHHLYQAREVSADESYLPDLLLAMPRFRVAEVPNPLRSLPVTAGMTHQRLLEDLAPPSILVDEERNAVHLSESAGRFLQPPGGTLTHDVTRLVRSELQAELRAALFLAFERGATTLTPFLSLRADGGLRRVALLVRPRPGSSTAERMALVVFIEDGDDSVPTAGAPEEETSAAVVRQLEAELRRTHERLATTREQYEAGNEELRAANEELQSINEEYRSTSEELETSKEELQSINEELETVNGELKAKLQEVSRAHSDLENLMAATDIGTLFLDRSLRIARFTPPVSALFNITEIDRGRSISDFTSHLDYGNLLADAREVLRGLTPVEREARSSDGRWYLVRIRPYRTVEDRIDGVVVTFVEFTARRAAEDALRASEERYRLLVEGVGEYAMLMADADGYITTWNSGAKKLFGRTEEETIGQPIAVLFTEEDRATGVPARELATAERDGTALDDRWQSRKDGARFWASGVTTALRDSVGRLRGFAKVLRDNTERQAAQAARLHFRALFESAPGLYAVLRPNDYTIVAASDSYLAATMTRREEIVGRVLFDVFPDDPADEGADGVRNLRASLERVKATNRADVMAVQRYPIRRPAIEGGRFEERWWSPVNSPVAGPEGGIAYIIHRIEDVTPFMQQMRDESREPEGHELLETRAKHMEAEIVLRAQELQRVNDELRRLNTVLEERASERERLLAAAQDARTEAERQRLEAFAANDAKTQFLATMSHELRTPLNAIAGHVQLIELELHGPVTSAQHEALGRVDRAQRHLLALINDVLNFTRLGTGKVEYDVQPVDLGAVMSDMASMIEPQLTAKGISCEVRSQQGQCVVWADLDKLRQIMLNLLVNAIKFTSTGGRIALDVIERDTTADVVYLRVRDTGVGVAREKQDMIFDPFVQVRRTPTQVIEGVGLGLTISRDLARGMGGDLRVRSSEGHGSTFTLTLRRVGEGAESPGPPVFPR